MQTSLTALLTSTALLSVSGMGVDVAARTHAAIPANPCAAALPANRGLSTQSGIQTYTTLRGGGYTFSLNQFGLQGLDKEVRRSFGLTLPAGDAVATWSFTLPGGRGAYVGVAHVFRQGAQSAQGPIQHVCLWGGIGYLNLGTGTSTLGAQAVAVTLDALISVRTGLPGQVDLRVNGAHYLVAGYTLVRQGCRASRSGGLRRC